MLKIYLVLGEESGDKLGADLVPALRCRAQQSEQRVEVVGLAGSRLKELGVQSLFDIEDIAVMGFTAVLARLPKIMRRVYQTVSDIVDQNPDVIVLIDSPDFTHAVAKRVRKKLPNVPIINYVCPSVWAWRSGRAKTMCAYIDHVLAILPFEPRILKELGGPASTYIGHPMVRQLEDFATARLPKNQPDNMLLVLPGSRRGEIKRMLSLYGQTLTILRERGVDFHPVMPAVAHLRSQLELDTADWPVKPEIVDSSQNSETFSQARAALATSGTVALELALHRVPMAIGYRMDPIMRGLSGLITAWSSILPSLIVDRVLVPEEHNDLVIPGRMARHLEQILVDGPARQQQLDGFEEMAQIMQTPQPPGELAAEVIFDHLK